MYEPPPLDYNLIFFTGKLPKLGYFWSDFTFLSSNLSMEATCYDGLEGHLHLDKDSNFGAKLDLFQVYEGICLPQGFHSEYLKLHMKVNSTNTLFNMQLLGRPLIAGMWWLFMCQASPPPPKWPFVAFCSCFEFFTLYVICIAKVWFFVSLDCWS